MKVEVGLDNIRYTKKPEEGPEFAQIKKRAANNWIETDLQKLADYAGNKGHAILPGHLVGGIKAENCTGMQLFTLDFDDGVRYEEIKNRCIKWVLPIAFAYETLSSTPAKQKFRVVFAHDTLIDDLSEETQMKKQENIDQSMQKNKTASEHRNPNFHIVRDEGDVEGFWREIAGVELDCEDEEDYELDELFAEEAYKRADDLARACGVSEVRIQKRIRERAAREKARREAAARKGSSLK